MATDSAMKNLICKCIRQSWVVQGYKTITAVIPTKSKIPLEKHFKLLSFIYTSDPESFSVISNGRT